MGFESYNFDLSFPDATNEREILEFFTNNGYSHCGVHTLEKALDGGFIEVLLDKNHVSIRTAKANDTDVILEILKDIDSLKSIIQVNVFDLQLKENVSSQCFDEVFSNFERLQKEFQEYYPSILPPVRCGAVFDESYGGGCSSEKF